MNFVRIVGVSLFCFAYLVPGCGYQESQLKSFVAEQKSTLPKILFADVEVVDMEAGADQLIYYCKSPEMDEPQNAVASEQMKVKAESFVKRNRDALSPLIDNQIKMLFIGRTPTGEEQFRVLIEPWK